MTKKKAPVQEDDDDSDDYDDEPNAAPKGSRFYHISFYAPYFNVSTFQVLDRLRRSLWPFCSKTSFYGDCKNIDLYGPIWIMLTLIVEIAIVGFINY